jgi:uncharacterized protein YfcZ (UPF0381/DUF406 family)
MSDTIIDESNFSEYFHSIKDNKPKKGQVLARYTAMADLVDGDVKDFIVNNLLNYDKGGNTVTQVMKYHCHATDEYASSVPLLMAQDLQIMSVEEVKKKPYRFQLEYFYWTEPENIPKDDVHWECITVTKSEIAYAEQELEDMEKKEKEADEKM